MPYQRKWWSGHELYGIRPQEYRYRENIYQEYPYIDLASGSDEEMQFSYWKSLYPERMKRIQEKVEETCETLEYDDSPMYDEYPDKIYLRRLCSEIYEQLADEGLEEAEELPGELFDTSLSGADEEENQEVAFRFRPPNPPGPGPRPPHPPGPGPRPPHPPGPGPRPPRPRPPRPQPPKNSWLRDAIEVLLYQEMHKRRCERGGCRRRFY